MTRQLPTVCLTAALLACCTSLDQPRLVQNGGEERSSEDLAKKTQNPVSDLISLPFQNNINFDVGPGNDVQNVLNIQPVVPVKLTAAWTLINRAIAPVIYQPELVAGQGSEFGLGDINYTGFLSPSDSGEVIWGVGPVVSFPTATDSQLGPRRWGLGASAVALTMPGRWVVGGLINNVWSVGGSDRPDVNQMLLQPFVNYNFEGGWYLSAAPIVTANWEASSSQRWTVPIGGGGGKIFRIGKQPMNAQVQAFYNLEHPDLGPEWTLRLQLQFIF